MFDSGLYTVLGLFDGQAGLWQFGFHLAICFQDAVVDGSRLSRMGDVDKTRPVCKSRFSKLTHDHPRQCCVGVATGENGSRCPRGVLAEFVADDLRA